jgi:hypothetical protein
MSTRLVALFPSIWNIKGQSLATLPFQEIADLVIFSHVGVPVLETSSLMKTSHSGGFVAELG